ncbi:hypothetical protein SDRG_12082 [Saprolegnia diclina VS20]|uniref:Uncharacterized protein n=1 Tax=Saprolegnia diclina (strain VS20) TaxID=1156394 RepID=T0RJY2_SAPDV|nr:hypothetical protein SDRG_12082 [Saprolegnia diclina VS20]EQC30232.1 hypothetical protein SDRG_12082 [Saprolegnia diclina VS20]|eukprot:XP_008616364.1 hypothetical protein SDRG_12082 [Saprolegnia diclina VS20]
MASVVLTSPPLAARIFGFQFGIYEDIRHRFLEARSLTLVKTSLWIERVYVFPPGFRPIHHCNEPTMPVTFLSPYTLGLARDSLSDARLPLHLAIYEGDFSVTQRILTCRPDLASAEAIDVAFYCTRFAIASYLMALRRDVPQLGEHLWASTDGIPSVGQHLPESCATYGDIALLQLLKTYTTVGWTDNVLRTAITFRTPDMAEYIYIHEPETRFPGALDAAVRAGKVSLVHLLRRDGYACSADALSSAVARGYLDIVHFLIEDGVALHCDAIGQAVAYERRDTVAYLLSLANVDLDIDDALALALQRGDAGIVNEILATGRTNVPAGAVLSALQERQFDVARCLLLHSGVINVAAVDAALLGKSPALLLALLQEFGIEPPTTAM